MPRRAHTISDRLMPIAGTLVHAVAGQDHVVVGSLQRVAREPGALGGDLPHGHQHE